MSYEMAKSKIEWTEHTWNPTTGCTKVSAGCKFCYAEIMSKRLKAMGVSKYQNGKNGFKPTIHPQTLKEPYTWKTPRLVFVNSMSDLFHEDIPFSFIKDVFRVMNENPQHTFQVLTKRPDILYAYNFSLKWTPNIWMGVSVETNDHIDRIDTLCNTSAFTKFVSCEPLLGPLSSLNVNGLDWVIVGGESGRSPRPIKAEWVRHIRDLCAESLVPFFFKQWGGTNKKKSGRILDGKIYDSFPDNLFSSTVGKT